MITQDDIEAMRDDRDISMPRERIDYMRDPVFQRLQWEVRSAFEAGFTAAGGDKGQSVINPSKGVWFDHWMDSKSRAFLIANDLMTGEEGYK